MLSVPHLTPDQLADLVGKAAAQRIPLLNQVIVLADPATARKRNVENSLNFLSTAGGELLDVARQDLAAMDAWRAAVEAARHDFEARYRTEFLNGDGFRRFDEARDRLLNLIELPGAGRGFALVLWVLRLPYQAVRNLAEKAIVRPPAVNLSEDQVLENAFRAWLDQLGRRRSAGPILTRSEAHQRGFADSRLTGANDQFRPRSAFRTTPRRSKGPPVPSPPASRRTRPPWPPCGRAS